MKRKFLALLFTGLMSVSMFGCSDSGGSGNSTDESPGSDGDSQSTAATESNTATTDGDLPDAGGATITIWMPPFGTEDTTDKEFWTKHLAEAAEAINANISIETIPWDNYEEKYMTGVASGTGPDIGYMYNEMLYNGDSQITG